MSTPTPFLGLIKPVTGDTVAQTIADLASNIAALDTMAILSGPLGSRPPADVADRYYMVTDQAGGPYLTRDTGVAWEVTRAPLRARGAFRAVLAANQSVPSGADTVLALATELYDIESDFDPVAYSYTARRDGLYLITGTLLYVAGAAGADLYIGIYKNGVFYTWFAGNVGADPNFITVGGSQVMQFAAGDVLKFYAFQSSGVAQSLIAGDERTVITGTYLGSVT